MSNKPFNGIIHILISVILSFFSLIVNPIHINNVTFLGFPIRYGISRLSIEYFFSFKILSSIEYLPFNFIFNAFFFYLLIKLLKKFFKKKNEN